MTRIPLSAPLAKSADPLGRTWSVVDHGSDTSVVAQYLVDAVLAKSVLRMLKEDARCDHRELRRTVGALARIHDVGKISPSFAAVLPGGRTVFTDHGCDPADLLVTGPGAHHAVIGQIAFDAWLKEQWSPLPDHRKPPQAKTRRSWTSPVAGHHGRAHGAIDRQRARDAEQGPNTTMFADLRHKFLEEAEAIHGFMEIVERTDGALPARAQMVLTAIVIMADWIASNQDYFPHDQTPHERRLERAILGLELPPRWAPATDSQSSEVRDHSAGVLPVGCTPRPGQQATLDAALTATPRSLFVIEDLAGSGKTEAALMAAHALCERHGLNGVFFGLPTMATADAMFSRVLRWAEAADLPAESISVNLHHSRKQFNSTFTILSARGATVDVDADGAESNAKAHRHAWLRRKMAMQAQLVVATVDPALGAALNVKHVVLQHLALASKVVIIDEVHAYDAFMISHLCRLLEWLGVYETPVILMSATLPGAVRQQLVSAYSGQAADPEPELRYPCLTVADAKATTYVPFEATAGSKVVDVRWLPDDDALLGVVASLISNDGCLLFICNTVSSARRRYAALKDLLPDIDVRLCHSQFTGADRAARDMSLLQSFGPSLAAEDRPRQSIVVATQVAEQSLDVDFDVLVTDLAPVDLIIQRVGRLHRHERSRPAQHSQPAVYVVNPDVPSPSNPPRLARGSVAVYGAWPLLRSAYALLHVDTLDVPGNVRPLMETAYGATSDIVPSAWRAAAKAAEDDHEKTMSSFKKQAEMMQLPSPGALEPPVALHDALASKFSDGDPESPAMWAMARLGAPSVEVLIAETHPQACRDSTLPYADPEASLTDEQAEELLRTISRVTVYPTFSNDASTEVGALSDAIFAQMPTSWKSCSLLGRYPVLTLANGEGTVGSYHFTYTAELGMEINRV